jgi:adapter protein MecA 1/2
MNIEKINDNQFRCTLSSRDLALRQLNINELAYGSEKARSLFHEMIEKASDEIGFEVEDMPLMVEAIPLPSESIMLIITKVEEPEELDTRFSRFSSFDETEDDSIKSGRADDILDIFKSLFEKKENEKKEENEKTLDPTSINILRIYTFDNLESVIEASHILHQNYNGINSLYKDEQKNCYYLTLNKSYHTPEEFNKACNILSEYGQNLTQNTPALEAYFNEHYTCIVKDTALQRLYLF